MRSVDEYTLTQDSEDLRVLQNKVESNQSELDYIELNQPSFLDQPEAMDLFRNAPSYIEDFLRYRSISKIDTNDIGRFVFNIQDEDYSVLKPGYQSYEDLCRLENRVKNGHHDFGKIVREWFDVEPNPTEEKLQKLITFAMNYVFYDCKNAIEESADRQQGTIDSWVTNRARLIKQSAVDKNDLKIKTELLLSDTPITVNRNEIKQLCKEFPYINEKNIRLRASESGIIQEFIFTTHNIIGEVTALDRNEAERIYDDGDDHALDPVDIDGFMNFTNNYVAIPPITWKINFYDNSISGRRGAIGGSAYQHSPVDQLKFNPFHPCPVVPSYMGFSDHQVPHPHFTARTSPCFGDWDVPIHEAIRTRDIQTVMGLVTTFQQSIDRIDPAGKTWINLFKANQSNNIKVPLCNYQLPPALLPHPRSLIKDFIIGLKVHIDPNIEMEKWVEAEFIPPPALELDSVYRMIRIMPDLTPRLLLLYFNNEDYEGTSNLSVLHGYHHHLDDQEAYFRKNYKVLYLPKGSIGTPIPFQEKRTPNV